MCCFLKISESRMSRFLVVKRVQRAHRKFPTCASFNKNILRVNKKCGQYTFFFNIPLTKLVSPPPIYTLYKMPIILLAAFTFTYVTQVPSDVRPFQILQHTCYASLAVQPWQSSQLARFFTYKTKLQNIQYHFQAPQVESRDV